MTWIKVEMETYRQLRLMLETKLWTMYQLTKIDQAHFDFSLTHVIFFIFTKN